MVILQKHLAKRDTSPLRRVGLRRIARTGYFLFFQELSEKNCNCHCPASATTGQCPQTSGTPDAPQSRPHTATQGHPLDMKSHCLRNLVSAVFAYRGNSLIRKRLQDRSVCLQG